MRLRLAAELADDRVSIGRLASAVQSLVAPAADARGEWMRGLALAFEVERYSTAIESTLSRVLRTLDGDVPAGPGSHQEILRAAAVPVAGLRPVIVPPEALDDLRELLRFRHLARHGYDAEPVLTRMVEHAERVGRVHPRVAAALLAVEQWLELDAGA